MGLIEITDAPQEASLQQRWSHALALIAAGLLLLFGLNRQANALSATTPYQNVRAGISAVYPQNWLLDEDGDYVFRVRDMSQTGFKTTMLIETRPLGSQTRVRDILNTININRPLSFVAYDVLSEEQTTFGEDTQAVVLDYTFVSTEANPFLESIPTPIIGRDILTVRGNQVIILRFLSDASTFESNLHFFEQFVGSVEFQ